MYGHRALHRDHQPARGRRSSRSARSSTSRSSRTAQVVAGKRHDGDDVVRPPRDRRRARREVARGVRRADRAPGDAWRCERRRYDVVVIGSGPGGYVAAIRVRAARPQDRVRRAREPRRHLPQLGLHPDQGAAQERRGARARSTAPRSSGSPSTACAPTSRRSSSAAAASPTRSARASGSCFKKNKIEHVAGHREAAAARRRVEAAPDRGRRSTAGGKRVIEAKHVIIATGARARSLPGIELDGKRIIEYRKAMTLPDAAEVDGRARRGRDRRRVRVVLSRARRRGHDRRVPAAPRPERGSRDVSKELAQRVRQARHQDRSSATS